jgi:hypothetical protein
MDGSVLLPSISRCFKLFVLSSHGYRPTPENFSHVAAIDFCKIFSHRRDQLAFSLRVLLHVAALEMPYSHLHSHLTLTDTHQHTSANIGISS